MARSRIRYPEDDFPIVLAIGALGVAGLAYFALRRKPPAPYANMNVGASPPVIAAPPPSPPATSNRNVADVQRRYREIQEQATFDTRGLRGQEGMLAQLAVDLDAARDTRAANDVRAILDAVRRL